MREDGIYGTVNATRLAVEGFRSQPIHLLWIKGLPMTIKELIKKMAGWALKALAVFAVPALFPASVGVDARVGWVGTVLVWLYMGRVMKENLLVEE